MSLRHMGRISRLLLVAAIAAVLSPVTLTGPAALAAPPASVTKLSHAGAKEAARCLREGRTQCAVENMAWAYSELPKSKEVKQAYFDVLILDVRRDLTFGEAWAAGDSLTKAIDLKITGTTTITNYYTSLMKDLNYLVYSDNMDYGQDSYDETFQYLEVPGSVSDTTNALSGTANQPGFLTWREYKQSEVYGDFLASVLFFPANQNGYSLMMFGVTDITKYVVNFGWESETTPFVIVDSCVDYGGGCEWEQISLEFVPGVIEPKQWHQLDIQVVGTSLTVNIDGEKVLTAIVADYTSGFFSLGVGQYTNNLGNRSSTGPSTYTGLFDNLSVWSLS